MATQKPKAKKAKRPKGDLEGIKVARGLKKEPATKSEVAGHTSPGAWYRCWNDGALNYVPFGWNYFYCWRCGALNYV
jgi:hypothetical protein